MTTPTTGQSSSNPPPPAHPQRHHSGPNRLAKESSPYLLQHAHNPVDWFPWGEEAIREARRRDVPIFLSVGYSTCYWCHVMERESFEDPAIGALMSERFVCVKVDREERPDVDHLYMTAVQVLTGRGGWPMSVFIEPERLRPYWAGTYFPPAPRHGLPSFRQALEGMSEAWWTKRADVLKQAGAVGDAVTKELTGARELAGVGVGRPQVAMAVQALMTMFDRTNGGFGGAPKFPQPVYLELLLDVRDRLEERSQRDAIDAALRTTLDKMALGGMNDQVGGGFHRYSVDAIWLVPHFEKMLYDQAQLLSVYARAATVYGDAFYARVAQRTAGYVLREMTGGHGGFATAQDAEVDGREGLNYLWTAAEFGVLLGPEDGPLAAAIYGVSEGPNFKDPHHPEQPAMNVLRLAERPEATAGRLGLSTEQLLARLDRVNEVLYAARAKRKQPRLDDKVLTSWNGLMIGALANAARLLEAPELAEAGARAAEFVLGTMVRDGRLLRTWRDGGGGGGEAKLEGVLEDYAMLAHGLLALERSGEGGAPWGARAKALIEQAEALFGDGRGGWWDTRADQADLFVRARTTYDGAVPSGVSFMLHAQIDLAELEGGGAEAAARTLVGVSGPLADSPVSTANSTRGLLRLVSGHEPELVAALADSGATAGWAQVEGTRRGSAGADVVEVFADQEAVSIGLETPGEFTLRLRIAPGHHLVAADPGAGRGAGGLHPTRVGVAGGGGIKAYADYPPGERLEAGDPEAPLVYRGEVEFKVAVERSGDWAGTPRVTLSYQACTDQECQLPTTVALDVEVLPLG